MRNMVTVAIIMTCFNRREKTARCLETVLDCANKDIKIDVYLTDDGSTDGTGDMVRKCFPGVIILQADGSLYWNKGMHRAFSAAEKVGYDFYLWVNDDVVFDGDVVSRLVAYYYQVKRKDETIIVGYTENEERTEVTYAGFIREKSIIPLSMRPAFPDRNTPVKIDTFHGNCVLISSAVVRKIGIMDSYYSHGMGDADYGHTATRNGCDIWLTTFPVGVCEKNYIYDGLYERNLSLLERYRFITGRKQRPVKDWWHFTTKNGGMPGILRFIITYAKIPYIHIRCRYLGRQMKEADKLKRRPPR